MWVRDPKEKMDVTEGENVVVNVTARGNPNGVTYLWRRGEEVVMAGNVLNITGVTKDQAGMYTVEASNSQGTTARNVSLHVKCEFQEDCRLCVCNNYLIVQYGKGVLNSHGICVCVCGAYLTPSDGFGGFNNVSSGYKQCTEHFCAPDTYIIFS